MNPQPRDDLVLWRELRELYDAIDPVPPEVLAVAHGALTFRTFDAELAQLVGDSARETVAAMRDDGPGRLITFKSESVTIELQVSTTGVGRHLVGQLVPPSPAAITVDWPTGHLDAEADALGRFSAADVPSGPVRFACRRTDEPATVTDWLVI